MSEVKKLYELAGIENYSIKGWTGFVPNKYKIIADDDDNVIDIVLDFTAEKQIAILQLLTQRCDLTISHFTEWEFIHYDGQEPLEITGTDFVETFAKLINAYWRDLTEQERTEIAEILRG